MNLSEARSRFLSTTFAPLWADLQGRMARLAGHAGQGSAPTALSATSAKALGSAEAWLKPAQGEPNLWEAAKTLGTWANTPGLSVEDARAAFAAITSIREFQGELARTSQATTMVVFGTSGWREAIGEGVTVLNVRKTVRAIGEVMILPEYATQNGFADATAVKKAGVLVFRDNRYMGDSFMVAACDELAAQGFKLYDAGMCPTGVGSALVKLLGASGSINFTPSHNPMEYAGIKFNPADGGPADVEWTSQIETRANAYMQGARHAAFKPAPATPADGPLAPERVDAKNLFTRFVAEQSQVFNLRGIRDFLRTRKSELHLVIDFMHGSARGYVESLLGDDLVSELEAAGALSRINNNEDFAFHGVKPEPSATNQKPLMQKLKASGRPLTLAVALDPDADRIRFADAELDVDMNRFGAIAFAHFVARGLPGGLCTTVPSSGLAAAVAKKQGRHVYETAVGFKHFRPYLGTGKAMMAFEESDGISFMGHTLEKCALAGFLAALEIMAQSGKSLSVISRELESEYGFFHPAKGGVDLVGVSVEAWQDLKGKVMKALTQGLVAPGQTLALGNAGEHKVAQVLTLDGLKVVLDDGSWLLLRASGTEPKFRFYVEWIDTDGKADASAQDRAYLQAAEALLAQARAKAGG
jgi:phosphomannomutase